ncbi:MAG: alcohol dehydrogenase [Anaerolineales bacterium]|nr:MAG: alcohol dehydrogenase [Anaerolineales bacterium]
MQFEFTTASRIIFGPGRISTIPALIEEFGTRILVFNGAPPDISNRLVKLLADQQMETMILAVKGEPTVASIQELVEMARQFFPDGLIAIGGGSTLDTAKAVSALLTNPGDVSDYLEVIGLNLPLKLPSIPLVAIPTTAGTGTEVTRNAVIGSSTHRVKVSLRSQYLLPRIALIDPELTLSLPPFITASTGLDALTQLIEPYTSNSPNPLTDAVCVEGIRRIAHAIKRAFEHGEDLEARQDMSLATLMSGIALANSRLGAVHGFAGPIGGEIAAPHGAVCASLLAEVMSANMQALLERDSQNPVLERYTRIARLLTGNPAAFADDGIAWVRDFCDYAGVQPLSKLGLSLELFPLIIEKAQKSSSMKGNPVLLTVNELRSILETSM